MSASCLKIQSSGRFSMIEAEHSTQSLPALYSTTWKFDHDVCLEQAEHSRARIEIFADDTESPFELSRSFNLTDAARIATPQGSARHCSYR